jgi:hypothetical protein
MVNGVAWSSADIKLLVQTIEANGCPTELARHLNRSPEAVLAKARKLKLKLRQQP